MRVDPLVQQPAADAGRRGDNPGGAARVEGLRRGGAFRGARVPGRRPHVFSQQPDLGREPDECLDRRAGDDQRRGTGAQFGQGEQVHRLEALPARDAAGLHDLSRRLVCDSGDRLRRPDGGQPDAGHESRRDRPGLLPEHGGVQLPNQLADGRRVMSEEQFCAGVERDHGEPDDCELPGVGLPGGQPAGRDAARGRRAWADQVWDGGERGFSQRDGGELHVPGLQGAGAGGSGRRHSGELHDQQSGDDGGGELPDLHYDRQEESRTECDEAEPAAEHFDIERDGDRGGPGERDRDPGLAGTADRGRASGEHPPDFPGGRHEGSRERNAAGAGCRLPGTVGGDAGLRVICAARAGPGTGQRAGQFYAG